MFGNLVPFFMDEKYFQEVGPVFLWVKNIFRNLVPIVMGEKYSHEFGPIFYG